MRIGINARYIQKQASGIENYLSNIINNLAKIDSENEYTLFFGSDRPLPSGFPKDNFAADVPGWKTDSQLKRVLWQHFYLPGAIKRHKLDVFHEPSFIAPVFKKCPTVITVYDIAFITHPECFTRRNVFYLKYMLARSIRSADAVIAISENTKRDIIKYYNTPEHKVKVVYCGTNEYFHVDRQPEKLASVRKKFGIRGDYILNVSLISPRKNLGTLIRAYKILRDSGKIAHQLVIAGGKGWLYEDIFKLVASLGLEKDVIFTGFVSNEDLFSLYNGASVFAYPSVYEGFGLPVVEAMACGCPVVASNTSSLPEICGDAALMIAPEDAGALGSALLKVIEDGKIRSGLINKGFERIKLFTWRKAAQQTLDLYKNL